MKFPASLPLLALSLLLSGCLPINNFETVTLQTTAGTAPISGAECTLNNRKGTWIVTTPGSVSVHLGSEQLGVKCVKDGYMPATQMENSSVDMTGVLIDGAIAATVSGSAWSYPQMITVPMTPLPAAPAPVASKAAADQS